MKKYIYIIIIVSFLFWGCFNNTVNEEKNVVSIPQYPEYTEETEVEISGYNMDCMEPFISKDGKYLFFNSLNDSVNTSLFYATATSDIAFEYKGEVANVNGIKPHLDAVSSMDINNNFYWVSTRNYPTVFENLQTGEFTNGEVKNSSSVKGNFYIRTNGWIIMDAEISADGKSLYYVNSKFSGNAFPDEAKIGIAAKGETDFNKIDSSENILKNINNSEYIVYAPSISNDETELYFTRIKKGSADTEMCVSIRKSKNEPFSVPKKIEISGIMAEAPTLTLDGKRLYYHKKMNDGKYHIFCMRRK